MRKAARLTAIRRRIYSARKPRRRGHHRCHARGNYESPIADRAIPACNLSWDRRPRIITLAGSGRLAQPAPFLDIVRENYMNLGSLAADTAFALRENLAETFGWERWEGEGQRE